MRYKGRKYTRIQRNFRKAESSLQSQGFIIKKKPRWRQLERQLKKARNQRYASMKKRLAAQEQLKIDI